MFPGGYSCEHPHIDGVPDGRPRSRNSCSIDDHRRLFLDGTDPITTTATTRVTPGTSATETTEDSTATTGSMLSEWDRQLRDNAKVQPNLAVYLDETGAADDDP
jgi:hypothetical protein